MDRKTLEYMEERARKARAIVRLIENLQHNIEQIHAIESVIFLDQNYSRMFDSSIGNLTEALKNLCRSRSERNSTFGTRIS